ncbi:hypothetical protein pkur_cds_592 [Pandoravirus kuranda]|uniref:Uncharacterized protein n=1 Tax=Pandoravirus kuranda TaxID=3019033 RepID=A0AA95ED07_9VIRU|nr:hypothetical protein pkur_cds_592 [Pandoravirus kuranda]
MQQHQPRQHQDAPSDQANIAYGEDRATLVLASSTATPAQTDVVPRERRDTDMRGLDGFARVLSRLAQERRAEYPEYYCANLKENHSVHDQTTDTAHLRALCGNVCREWEDAVRQHASPRCDVKGLNLCISAVERLGLSVHSVETDATKKDGDPLFPKIKQCSRLRPPGPRDDDGHAECADDTGRLGCIGRNDRTCEGTDCESVGRPTDDPQSMGTSRNDGGTSARIVLTCSRPLACGDPSRENGQTTVRLALKVCIGTGDQPWATAGSVVDMETGVIIPVGCTLVCHLPPEQGKSRRSTIPMKRRRLADFLASGKRTWRAFAEQRYAHLRCLPGALTRHGWTVRETVRTPWSWSATVPPNAEYDERSLVLRREDVPVSVTLFLLRGRLAIVPGGATGHCDATPCDVPGVFAADPIDAAFYSERDVNSGGRCDAPFYGTHRTLRTECARQRARLVGMGLVSPLVLMGRQDRFCERTNIAAARDDRYDFEFLRPVFASRAVVHGDLDRLPDMIERHIAQSVFGEYGPVDDATGRHLNGGTCDDLVGEALASGRLSAGLAYIATVSCKMYESLIDPFNAPMVDAAPRLIVNWRGQFEPTYVVRANTKKRLPLIVSAAIALQSNGCGGAYVAISVPTSRVGSVIDRTEGGPSCRGPRYALWPPTDDSDDHSEEDEEGDEDVNGNRAPDGVDDRQRDERDEGYVADDRAEINGAVWRGLIARCADNLVAHPHDLHPTLALALETERSRAFRVCFVPWAYSTSEQNTCDVRSLTAWVLGRVAEILAAFDASVAALCASPQ